MTRLRRFAVTGPIEGIVPEACDDRIVPRQRELARHWGERVALFGLNSLGAGRVHHGEARVGDDHVVPRRFQLVRDPVAFRCRLEKSTRGRAGPQHRSEPFATRDDPAFR